MFSPYYRPLVQFGPKPPEGAVPLAGGPGWFTHAEEITRDGSAIVVAAAIPKDKRAALSAPRAAIAGLAFDRPRIMGILNTTPDSFSDGGLHRDPDAALAAAEAMALHADLIDIGGESTRPGAETVDPQTETLRTAPIIAAMRDAGLHLPISIDTRKAAVARAAHAAGASLVNDVSGFTHDPALAPFCAAQGLPVCVMHAQGDPATMQDDPHYDNVLLDVYDFLAGQVATLEQQGLPRKAIIVDPGIGFGKTQAHNLTLLQNISIFHGLGCPILLGASRKGFIGRIGEAPDPQERAPGSIAVALAATAQGVQIVRVHDVSETRQAIALWQAVQKGAT
ncbi:dihydropteroate synthase [Rhodalgimonas zhirmunskyi]|uniref:Dihydropteroate synthase n=1 Tax=Rhodalgimonas zhirmunskyi TaxID=2964767 RepID=A0AAJ1U4G6_9RHOB|nr:dihydropteroate synthase [Rhodoalgimonas zhirmunskyi]MDQ2093505.1 dihydropteroate synthase [Rhodoalgimonas zhirmunskyi]